MMLHGCRNEVVSSAVAIEGNLPGSESAVRARIRGWHVAGERQLFDKYIDDAVLRADIVSAAGIARRGACVRRASDQRMRMKCED